MSLKKLFLCEVILVVHFFSQTADRLMEVTYSRLPATNYSILYQFYTFLQWCVEKGASVHVRERFHAWVLC